MWSVSVRPQAARDLDRAPERVRDEALDMLEALGDDPNAVGAAPMRGRRGLYRVYLGEGYRMVYHLEPASQQVAVLRIAHRSTVYS